MAQRRTRKTSSDTGYVQLSPRHRDLLSLAKERFKQADDATKEQRQREREDLRFYAGDQWPDDIRAARAGQNASNGLPPVPARPCITINGVRNPVLQVLNQERQSDMGITITPADDFEGLTGPIDDSEIELREGLVRRIQRESSAADARTWAFARAVQAGQGYYCVMTRYVTGKTFDQEVYVMRLYNQFSVSLEPGHEQPDGSDAEWGFVGHDMPWSQYKVEHPKSKVSNATDEEFRALGDDAPDWFTTTGETRTCRVVDYWYITHTPRVLVEMPDGTSQWKDELPEGTDIKGLNTREEDQRTVDWCQIDGVQVLDETEWPSPYIPIVKIVGEELQPYDTQRRVEGMVRPAREPGMGKNFMISKWVEMIGLTPIPPLMMAAGQQEGYEAWYEAATTRTLPYLLYNFKDSDGNPVGPPQTVQRDTPIAAVAASVQMFNEAIKDTTGVPSSTLGEIDPSLKSGKAIKQVLDQAARGTSNYLDNLARSIRYEAQIINSLLYPIYKRPGRIARMMTGEGESQSIMLHKPFTMQGPEGQQRPMPAQPGQPDAKTYTLTKDANYNVAIKVSKNYDTRRQEEAAITGDLISSEPTLMTWFGDLFFKNMDGPGHQEMADRAKVMLDPRIQATLKGQPAIPPEVQQRMAQLDQMAQLQHDKIQELQAEKDAKVLEQNTKVKIAEIDADKAIQVAAINTKSQEALARGEALAARLEQLTGIANDQMTQLHDHGHDVAMAAMQHEQAGQQADQAHSQQMEQADQNQQGALEQQQKAADLAPEPAESGA